MNNSNRFGNPTARKIIAIALAFALIAVTGWAYLHRDGAAGGMPGPNRQERKVLYWHDPMVPGQRFDKPGKSPFMDMELVPVYADEKTAETGVSINSRMLQNLGMRSAKVELGTFPSALDAVGVVKADERQIEVMQSRAAGWIERLQVRSLNDPVQSGQAVAEIYAPDLVAAQEEFLLAKKGQADVEHGEQLAQAARARLALLGLSSAQIEKLESSNQAQRRIALTAPANGIVTELNVRQGAYVAAGAPIMTITDLSNVWVIAEVPESQLGRLQPGATADIRFAALPGKLFSGTVEYTYPGIGASNRAQKLRIALPNPAGEFKLEMFASISLHNPQEAPVLLVPSEAVIVTGKRSVVIVNEGNGKFQPADVKIGREHDGVTEVLEGLREGQLVVTSGQFMIDSESSLKSTLKRLEPDAAAPASPK